MEDKKIICYILATFMLISIAASPVLAENFKVGNKVADEKLSNHNNIVVAKAATTNGSVSNSSSPANSNNKTGTVNTTKTSPTTQNTIKAAGGDDAPKKLKQSEILKASVYVDNYVSKNKKLPDKVNIGGYDFSIPEYTYLLSKTIYYKYNKKNTDVLVKYDVKNPTKPTGTKVKGTLKSKQYSTYVKNLVNYIEKNNRIPNYVNTKIGKMQYQTAVYGFNKILRWSYYNKNKIPSSLTLNIAKNHKINKVIPKYTRPHPFISQPTPDIFTGEYTIVQTKYSCGPIQIMYNSVCLISTGKCSCGKEGDYCYHEASFKNYCPYCKTYGCMIYEEGPTCPEGMWVCSKCDADFCLVCGKEHTTKSPKYLTPYN